MREFRFRSSLEYERAGDFKKLHDAFAQNGWELEGGVEPFTSKEGASHSGLASLAHNEGDDPGKVAERAGVELLACRTEDLGEP